MNKRQEALNMIKLALAAGNVRDAYSALGYCKCVLEAEESETEAKLEVIVESEAPMQEEHKPTFQEYCEAETRRLKHDIIAEEEKTYYLHRAYLKDEVCKRWPNTNTMIKKILHGNGIKNIEDFYEYFTIYGNWKLNDWLGLCTDDVIKFHNLYLTLNEESGCPADEKLIAYMPVDTHKSGMAKRMVRYLENMDICTKSQLRWYVHNIGDIPYTKGIGNDRIDALNNKVKEELAFHEM